MAISTSRASPTKSSADWLSVQIAVLQELARRNRSSLLDWSLAYRFFHGMPMRLPPAIQDFYRDHHPFVVIQKAAQVMISECLINTAFWVADTGQGGRGNALYVMPTQTQMDDFSQHRFDKAIAESSYLQGRLHPPPPGRGGPARKRLKRLGEGYIYFRGSEARRQITSVDADVVILDEYDDMADGVLPLAQKRLASSRKPLLRVVSTPRLPEAGINRLFLQSDQRYYFLPCPACGHRQRLEWAHNVDIERERLVCRRCREPMDLWAQGEWVPAAPGNRDIRGYHLNRLYSPMANVRQMIFESEASGLADIREFQNAVLAETFVPPGGQLTPDILGRCLREYRMPEGCSESTYMGVDVGGTLNVVIRRPLDEKRDRTQAVFIGEVRSFEDLTELGRRYNVTRAIVDRYPEQHKAREFAHRAGHMSVGLAEYGRTGTGHDLVRKNGLEIHRLNRTELLDEMFHAFEMGWAELPRDARDIGGRIKDGVGEYYRQMMAPKKVVEERGSVNWEARYENGGKADHYAHAEAYCLRAMTQPEGGFLFLT